MSQDTVENKPEDQPIAPQQPAEGEKQEPQTGGKWGFVIVGALVIALVVAVYLNKTVYGDREKKATAGATAAAPSDIGKPEPAEAPAKPRMTRAEEFQLAIKASRFRAAQYAMQSGDNVFILGCPARSVTRTEGGEPETLPGKMFDMTRMAAGVDRLSIYRRITGPNAGDVMYADGMPALGVSEDELMPKFGKVSEATLGDDEPVVGLIVGDKARAYPIRYLNYHEVVNDTLDDLPVAIVWNALADAPCALERRLGDKILRFGTAGLIYQGAIVVYDVETQSLWTPITARALSGPCADQVVAPLQTVETTWKYWRARYPDSMALIGCEPAIPQIDYAQDPQLPVEDYRTSEALVYPIEGFDVDKSPLKNKEVVLGIQVGDSCRAYPAKDVATAKEARDTIGGKEVRVTWDAAGGFALAADAQGAPILCSRMYWLVWKGNHPSSDVFGIARAAPVEKPAAGTP